MASDPFLLSVSYQDDGYTRFEFDNGPTTRVQVLSPPGASREILDRRPVDLLSYTLADTRPPAPSRRHPT